MDGLGDRGITARLWSTRWRNAKTRVLALLALAGFLVAIAVLTVTALPSGHSKRTTPTATVVASTPAPKPPAPSKPVVRPVRLTATAGYDPFGDRHENDDEAPRATDGDPATYWSTEHYHSWWKKGVGLVVDAGRPVKPTTLRLTTDTPGFTAEVRAGSSPTGPFVRISPPRTVTADTRFGLTEKTSTRYLVLWITRLGATPTTGGAAQIAEVKATSSQPTRP
jgi:hypothetical protein